MQWSSLAVMPKFRPSILQTRQSDQTITVPGVAIFQDSHDAYEVSWVVG